MLQALTIKAAVKDSSTDSENAMLLMERGRESKIPATRGQHLCQALQKLAALPAVKPPLPTGMSPLMPVLHMSVTLHHQGASKALLEM